jgi:hypothetical protein
MCFIISYGMYFRTRPLQSSWGTCYFYHRFWYAVESIDNVIRRRWRADNRCQTARQKTWTALIELRNPHPHVNWKGLRRLHTFLQHSYESDFKVEKNTFLCLLSQSHTVIRLFPWDWLFAQDMLRNMINAEWFFLRETLKEDDSSLNLEFGNL